MVNSIFTTKCYVFFRWQGGWKTRWFVYFSGSPECCGKLHYRCDSLLTICCIFLILLFIQFIIFLFCRWIMQDMRAMTDAAGNRPVILVNPKLKVRILVLSCECDFLWIKFNSWLTIFSNAVAKVSWTVNYSRVPSKSNYLSISHGFKLLFIMFFALS